MFSSYHVDTPNATRQSQARIRTSVLSSPRVRAVLPPDGEVAAAHELDEMAAAMHVPRLRVVGYFFRKVWKRLYREVTLNVGGLERIRSLHAQGYVPVYLPTHRSYIDFLILSFVLFGQDLPLPHIAAGRDFLGLSFLVAVLRAGGAFFLRRATGNDRVYAALLAEYVTELLAARCPLEFFIEGTRSRSGKTLRPKLGLLSIVVQAWRTGRLAKCALVPLHINYERLVEAALYPRELLGRPKRPESLRALFDARSVLTEDYGRIAIKVGDPIILGSDPVHAHGPLRTVGATLGDAVVHALNTHTVWSPTAVVSALLLACARTRDTAVPISELSALFSEVRTELLARSGVGHGDWLEGDAQALARRGLSHVSAAIATSATGDVYVLPNDLEAPLLLASYRNQLLYVFALEGMMLCAVLASDGASVEEVLGEALFLDAALVAEVIDRPDTNVESRRVAFAAALEALGKNGLVSIEQGHCWPSTLLATRRQRGRLWAPEFIWPFVESYWLAGVVRWQGTRTPGAPLDESVLLVRAQWLASLLVAQGRCYAGECVSKETLINALRYHAFHSPDAEQLLNAVQRLGHLRHPSVRDARCETLTELARQLTTIPQRGAV